MKIEIKRKMKGVNAMKGARRKILIMLMAAVFLMGGVYVSEATVYVQCPGDTDGDAVIDTPDINHLNATCMHLSSGDGFVNMADGKLQYIFSFKDVTGIPEAQVMTEGLLAAHFPAPTIVLKEGQEFYLTLTNVGMFNRPDLFDPHTVHFHGFPNASAIFDGVPDSSVSINMGASLTYYYNIVEPGTFMYHCHVEATEHMQMGMLGNLYVMPAQNDLPPQPLNGFPHVAGNKYVYNDGDGSTFYDVEYAIQLGAFDPAFHDASMNTQPLPFANMLDKYPMINGRGYPDTINPASLGASAENNFENSQPINSLITATQGDRILLRLSNLNVTTYHTLTALGIPMQVVGMGSKIFRGNGDVTGADMYYNTSSVTIGGGETFEVILDTASVPAGTYFLYTTNLNYLSNDQQDFGGMMTEIVINP
jgi:FtsP/CotA-like multicopper oxidase with cupredoxin domain